MAHMRAFVAVHTCLHNMLHTSHLLAGTNSDYPEVLKVRQLIGQQKQTNRSKSTSNMGIALDKISVDFSHSVSACGEFGATLPCKVHTVLYACDIYAAMHGLPCRPVRQHHSA